MSINIGIISVTVIGATICQRELDRLINLSDLDVVYTVTSCKLNQLHEILEKNAWQELAVMIIDAGKKIIQAGVNFIIIPSNTPHYVYKEIQSELQPVKILNLIDLVAQECAVKNYKKVTVLGTQQTMQQGLYNNYLNKHGVISMPVAGSLITKLDKLIKNTLVYGREDQAAQEHIEKKLLTQECDAFILGCTELPEVYLGTLANKPAIDTTRLLAQKAIEEVIHRFLLKDV